MITSFSRIDKEILLSGNTGEILLFGENEKTNQLFLSHIKPVNFSI